MEIWGFGKFPLLGEWASAGMHRERMRTLLSPFATAFVTFQRRIGRNWALDVLREGTTLLKSVIIFRITYTTPVGVSKA